MSKIICDVCGTSYPENANQCPICGCVRSAEAKTVSGNTESVQGEDNGTYTYVKGGRFSKKNVRKRNTGKPSDRAGNSKGKEKGLVITAVVLLIAIVAMLVYIAIRFLVPSNRPPKTENPVTTVATTTEATEQEIPCENLTVSNVSIVFDKKDAKQLLNVTPVPADTTDEVVFTSSDENVVTVSDGLIVAVGPGEATITITCGEQTATCLISCTFEGDVTTEPSEEPTEPQYDPADLKLIGSDVTLSKKGESWICYKGKIPANVITWTSDNEKVATVENGKVVATGKGNTKIHGEYGGKKVSCIIRCAPSVGVYVEPEQPVQSERKYHLNTANDITIDVGEEVFFKLLDASGNKVEAEFTCSNDRVCTLDDSTVTGKAAGTANVVAKFDGETHTCIVRVK